MTAPMPAPTPMPTLAPELSLECVLLPLAPPTPAIGEVVEGATDDVYVYVLSLDVKTVTELLPTSVDVNVLPLDVKVVTVSELPLACGEEALVEVGPAVAVVGFDAPDVAVAGLDAPDVAVAEFDTPEEPPPALLLAEAELCDGAADTEAREELGKWPTKNCMLCPVLCGSEHMLVRVFVSLNATVAEAAFVQLQYEPG